MGDDQQDRLAELESQLRDLQIVAHNIKAAWVRGDDPDCETVCLDDCQGPCEGLRPISNGLGPADIGMIRTIIYSPTYDRYNVVWMLPDDQDQEVPEDETTLDTPSHRDGRCSAGGG